jgi:cell division protein FtsZ
MTLNTSLTHLPELCARFPKVSIIGVGDEGNDVVSHIFEDGGSGAQCIAVNTDGPSLEHIFSHERVLIEGNTGNEPGITSNEMPRLGSIRECTSRITPLLTGADVAFIIVGTADANELTIATVTASIARRIGALTVGVAMIPSDSQRVDGPISPHALTRMRESCHTLAIVDVERSARLSRYSCARGVDSANQLVIDTVSGLSQALACPSIVNIELPAFRELMAHGGIAHVGIAHSTSSLKIEEATIWALRGPLLYDSIERCRGVLMNVRGDPNLTIEETERAAELIAERVGWNVPIVIGTLVDESWYGGCQVSILLTGGVYPYIPGGYRRLPLDMDEMEPDGEDEGPISLELDLDQLE